MFGYDFMIKGKRERHCSAEYQSESDALEAMLKRQREIAAGIVRLHRGRFASSPTSTCATKRTMASDR